MDFVSKVSLWAPDQHTHICQIVYISYNYFIDLFCTSLICLTFFVSYLSRSNYIYIY